MSTFKLTDKENKSMVLIEFTPNERFKTIEDFRNIKFPTYEIENLEGWTIKNYGHDPGHYPSEVDKDWKKLHQQIVNKIIKYCMKQNISPEDINLYIDHLQESLIEGCWVPSTDSSLIAIDKDKKYLKVSI